MVKEGEGIQGEMQRGGKEEQGLVKCPGVYTLTSVIRIAVPTTRLG